MTRTIANTIILIIIATVANIGYTSAQLPKGYNILKSPDGKSILTISITNDTTLSFAISRNGKSYIDTAQIYLSFGDSKRNAINAAHIKSARRTTKRDTLRSKIWERAVQPNHYNQLAIKFRDGQLENTLKIRMYNQGFATGIDINNPKKTPANTYYTQYHWTVQGMYHIIDAKTENGYSSLVNTDKATAIPPILSVSTVDSLLILTHEAANYEFFSRASVFFEKIHMTIAQNGMYEIANYSTPWHYVVFANNTNDFIEGKYIIRSLNMKPKGNYSWVKPGKVYRHIGNTDNDFATDNVKRSVDFAAQMNFQYILLDNGWYGLGYAAEFDPNSNPLQTVPLLNLPEVIKYAQTKGIGILLYFNKTALSPTTYENILTHYSQLGIKGIKLGFFKNRSQTDNVMASRIITKCASLGMVVNVHDEYRPTGIETLYPNLLTCEGLRGNEYLDNNGNHTTTLPFSRFMIGAGDYTICYEPNNYERLHLKTTKAHQLALSIILFSPLQHIFWHGLPNWYANSPETELFKEIPTVWDDYKVIGGYPRRYFSIARRKGNTWYVATITGILKTDISFPLSQITQKKSIVTIYEDGVNTGTIKKTSFKAVPDTKLDVSLRPHSGNVIVIKPELNHPQK